MYKKKKHLNGFTLIELIFVVTIIGLVMPSIFSLYTFITKSNREIQARQNTIQQGYEFFERLNVLMQDYTIDYEEYYNRQMVGCSKGGTFGQGSSFKRNTGLTGYCTEFTAYGNENSIKNDGNSNSNGIGASNPAGHAIYYCSNDYEQNKGGMNRVFKKTKCGTIDGRQSYGQYAALFTDVNGDTDSDRNLVGDSDDIKMGRAFNNINAIGDGNNVQELYFISHDGKNRLFFRRKLVNITGDNYLQYKIQILRLRGFDAGMNHDLTDVGSGNVGIYDGVIDTWACDAGMGFYGEGKSIGGSYGDYKLPKDGNDCWVDLTKGSSSILAWNIIISPLMDSDLAWDEKNRQINAYMKILTVNGIYLPYYLPGSVSKSISDFKVPLETTINMKDFYRI